jgi:peptidoglycan/xylan/chitin deacetylase (PgdA/CDA1 family)
MLTKKSLLILLFGFLPFVALSNTQDAGNSSDNGVRIHPLKGTVALTFDDGPTPEFTPQILAILKKYNVKATFFMVGNSARRYPDVVKQVADAGQAIGNHSLSHPFLTKLNQAQLRKEVVTPSEIIYKITGKKPVCLRYPFNDSNSRVRAYIRSQGMVPVPMGFNSFDYTRPGVDKIVAQVLNNAHSGQVFLLHDGFVKQQQTVDALPRIIEGIEKKGLGFSQICVN